MALRLQPFYWAFVGLCYQPFQSWFAVYKPLLFLFNFQLKLY